MSTEQDVTKSVCDCYSDVNPVFTRAGENQQDLQKLN